MNKRLLEQGPKHLCHLLSPRQLKEGLRNEIKLIRSLTSHLMKTMQWIRSWKDEGKALPPFLHSLNLVFSSLGEWAGIHFLLKKLLWFLFVKNRFSRPWILRVKIIKSDLDFIIQRNKAGQASCKERLQISAPFSIHPSHTLRQRLLFFFLTCDTLEENFLL